MRSVVLILLCLLTLLPGLPGAMPAAAETLTFRMSSDHENTVEIQMFARGRRNIWPSSQTVFKLEDYDEHEFAITCRSGERVCYGAYVAGDRDTYWGVGYRSTMGCRNCCHVCDGRTTKLIHLRAR